MSGLVVDTSAWIEWLAGRTFAGASAIDESLDAGLVRVPPVVVAELLSAPLRPTQRRELASFLGDLTLVATSFEHWRRVGELRAELSARGLTMSTPDAHVMQCALDEGARLLTRDAVFAKAARIRKVPLA